MMSDKNKCGLEVKGQQGFSLLEILVVLVILGLLISLVAPNVLNRVDDARIQKAKADISAIETALSIYYVDNFQYPTSEQGLEALIRKPDLDPVPANWKAGGYLKELPADPWGRTYLYLFPGERSSGSGHETGQYPDIYTLGADGISGGAGQNADIGNWKSDSEAL